MKLRTQNATFSGCLLVLGMLIFAILFAGTCFDYSLEYILDLDAPFPVDCLAGSFTSAITFPITIFCFVADSCGIEGPLIDIGKEKEKKPEDNPC